MSEQDKNNAKELVEALKGLNKEQQSYIKGVAAGIELERKNKDEQK